MNKFAISFRRIAALLFCTAAMGLVGCAQVKLAEPVASADNIQKAKAGGIGPVSVGEFKLAEGKDRSLDLKVSIRSNTFFSPYDSSLSKYLAESLKADLNAAGVLEPGASRSIRGELTQSTVDAPMGRGTASLAARFIVEDQGRKTYDKELSTKADWESSFVGAIAIPDAINQYVALYKKLVGELLDDPNFRKAVAR